MKKPLLIPLISVTINVFLLIEVILLIAQNRQLRANLNDLTRRPESLKPGEQVAGFKVLSLEGDSSQIAYDDSKKFLLFVFSTRCPICVKNLPNWNTLAELSGAGKHRVIGISLDKLEATKQYAQEKQMKFPVVLRVDTAFHRAYKIFGVPLTIMVGKRGIVERAFEGALTPEQMEELGNLLRADEAL